MPDDPRSLLAEGLRSYMSEDQVKALFDEILATKKPARGWCSKCRHAVQVEIADAKAVTSAITDLINQGFGRPKEAQVSDAERITFVREVKRAV